MNESELAKLVAYFTKDDDGDATVDAENLWARPLDANSGGGTYLLTNVGLFIPFAQDDIVRAQLNGHGRLAITGVESLSDRCVVNFYFDEEFTCDCGCQDDVDEDAPVDMEEITIAFARSLENHGVHVEGPLGALVTSWPVGWGPDEFKPVAEQCMGEHPGWFPSSWYTRESRAEEIELLLDGARGAQPPMASPEQAAYWASDDPGWAAIGVTEPDVLARMQMLAVTDKRVFATIQDGRHEDVLTYWERLLARNPNDLPNLDRPLLVEVSDED